MARTAILATPPPGKYPALPLGAGSAALPLTAADVANGNSTPLTGREILVIQNSDVGAQTITVSSVADPQGRSGDITAYSIPAGAFAVLGPFPVLGWRQADGNLYYSASAATVKVAPIVLPALA